MPDFVLVIMRILSVFFALQGLLFTASLILKAPDLFRTGSPVSVRAVVLWLTLAVGPFMVYAAWHLWRERVRGVYWGLVALMIIFAQWFAWAPPSLTEILTAIVLGTGLLVCLGYAWKTPVGNHDLKS